MLKYLLKRVLIFIPTLVVISLVTFMLSTMAPGDPVDAMLNKMAGGDGQASNKLATEKEYISTRHSLGLDLPIFYFSFSNAASCDTLYRIAKPDHRKALERLTYDFGNWPQISEYYHLVRNFELEAYYVEKNDSNLIALGRTKDRLASILTESKPEEIERLLNEVEEHIAKGNGMEALDDEYKTTKAAWDKVVATKKPSNKYIPTIHFYGLKNQYHRWITGFLVGDFGISYQDKRPVASVLWDALGWTVMISMISIFLSYLIAIPIGVWSAVHKGSTGERSVTVFLFILYSLPSFWIGTMLIIYLCGGDYLDWFPPAVSLLNLPDDASIWTRFTETAYHLILPIFCWTYGSLAYISRQMRGGMLGILGQDFIRTARAKGLNESTVTWKHAMRNSLLPIITMFAYLFPAAISGSVVIEFIFSIPGMGRVSLEALYARNYPIIYALMMFSAILTLVGTLVADILYAYVDPRISYSSKK